MAKITLPYILQNHNNADGGQVQQDLDAILAQVNGNLDGNNIAPSGVGTPQIGDGAVTLPKLASEIKVIENVYHIEPSDDINVDNETTTTIVSQSITLSVARYCLILVTTSYNWQDYTSGTEAGQRKFYLYNDATEISFHNDTRPCSGSGDSYTATRAFHYFGQIASGSHTIYLKTWQDTGAIMTVYHNYAATGMTIIQFAF